MSTETSLPAVKQNADTAATILDQLGGRIHPVMREAVDSIFGVDIEQNGEHSVEFLQGFFSGLMFANHWLVKTGEPSRKDVLLVADLAIQAARKYLDSIEKQLPKDPKK